MAGVFNIVLGLVFVIGGLSGGLVFRGTDSGQLLAVLGVVLVAYGGYQAWKAAKARS
jgi:hypothetical protein